MKKLMKLMMGIAVAAISFTGCENNFEGANVENKGFELTVVTDATRTEYDATLQDVKWSAGDEARVIVKGVAKNLAASIDAGDSRIASFSYTTDLTAGDEVTIQGFAPTATVMNEYDATEASGNRTRLNYVTISLPSVQNATTSTFDKSADLLVADDLAVTISAAEANAGKKVVGNFHFRRQVAITEFTYNVTNSELTASDEKVESVSFEVISANEDKFIAGNMRFQPTADGAKVVDSTGAEIEDNKNLFVKNQSNTVTVKFSDMPAVKSGFKAWFVTAPVTLEATDKLVFTVVTDKGTTITKTVEAVGKEVSFLTTQKNTLTVNLNNAVEIEKAEVNTFATATLTNADIVAINKAQAYADAAITITAADGSQWMFKGYRQAATANHLQLKSDASTTPYIKLPNVPGEIQSVVLTVGSASQSSASGGGNTRTYYFNDTIGASTAVVSGTGDSKITLDVAGKGKSTGYIQVNNATRVFAITVNYVAGEVPKNPTLTVKAQPETVAAAGGDVTVALTVKDLDEAVTATPSVSWITNATVNGDNLTFTVAANDVEQERNATITLKSGNLTATVNVKQEAKQAENPGDGDEGGEEVTVDFTNVVATFANSKLTWTSNGVTFVQEKAGSSTTAVSNSYNKGGSMRLYQGHTLTFSSEYNITKVEIVTSGKYYGKTATANVGTLTNPQSNGCTITWEGSSKSLVITNGTGSGGEQIRATSLKVTYKKN